MYKMTTVLGLALFSQLSLAGYTCNNQAEGVQLIVNHNEHNEAGGILKLNGKKNKLSGIFKHESDFHYTVNSYQLMDKLGSKVDLVVSTKTFMGRGGGCRARVCPGDFYSDLTTSKLTINGKSIFLNCSGL